MNPCLNCAPEALNLVPDLAMCHTPSTLFNPYDILVGPRISCKTRNYFTDASLETQTEQNWDLNPSLAESRVCSLSSPSAHHAVWRRPWEGSPCYQGALSKPASCSLPAWQIPFPASCENQPSAFRGSA